MLVRAIYKNGQIQPLEPVELYENQELTLIVTKMDEQPTPEEIDARLRAAGLLAEIDVPDDAELLTDEELNRIWELPVGARPSEDIIREERDER